MLKVEHVSYRYPNGERDVLQDVCCTLEDGQLSAIVGPSGSGKTTLLSILAGLDSPAEGSVSIDGEDYKSLDLDRCRRERIAMIFQAFHLFPLLNVVENVCFAMELNGVAKSKAVGPAKGYWGWWALGRKSTSVTRPICPVESSSGWPLPGPWPAGRV